MIKPFAEHTPHIAKTAYIDEQALVSGDVIIGEDSSVWPMASIRGDVNAIRIGNGTNIQDGCVLHGTHASEFFPTGYPVTLGNYITVGHQAMLHGCTIDDHCLIGMSTTVLDGAHIETKVLLGAGSVVPPGKVLSSGFLWLGNPVKKIRPLTEDELRFLEYSPVSYIRLKQQYLETAE